MRHTGWASPVLFVIALGCSEDRGRVDALRSSDEAERRAALRALVDAPGTTDIEALLDGLADADAGVRRAARDVVTAVASDHADAWRLLDLHRVRFVGTLDSEHADARCAGAIALRVLWTRGRAGPEAERALPRLIEMLGVEDREQRFEAASALGALGQHARVGLPALLENAAAADHVTRCGAISALGHIALEDRRVLEALTRALDDPEAGVRVAAIVHLSRAGSVAAAAAPALRERLEDFDANVRSVAAAALARVDPEPDRCITVMARRFARQRVVVREKWLLALGRLAERADDQRKVEVVRDLALPLLHDADFVHEARCALALVAVAQGDAALVEPFVAGLVDQSAYLGSPDDELLLEADLDVLDALAALSSFARLGIDRRDLARRLDDLARSHVVWVRESATRARARLR